MEFFINSQKFDITLDGTETLQIIFDNLDKWCQDNDLVINSITINEEHLFYSINDKEADIFKNKDDIKRVDIEAISYFEYAYNSFIGIIDYVRRISLAEVTDSMNISDIIEGTNLIIDSIPRTTFLLGTALEKHDIMSDIKVLEARVERLKELDNTIEGGNFFRTDIQPFLKDTFLKTLLILLDDVEINLLISLSNNILETNALYRIGILKSFIEPLLNSIDDIVSCIQTGDDKSGFLKIEKFSKSIEILCTIISKSLNVYDLDFNDIYYNEVAFLTFINELNANMNNIIEAFQNNDYVSVADILEYEVKEKISLLGDYIVIIERDIGLKIVSP